MVAGCVLWLAVHESGVHATLVGVVMGLMAPARPLRRRELIDEEALLDLSSGEAARETATMARESVSVVEWLEHVLHPWTSFAIVPLFALANAGIPLDASALANAATSRISWGVLIGLVAGKTIGISLFTWLAVRARVGLLPERAGRAGIVGVAGLGGIGFTVSIFVSGLAFESEALQNEAKIGILAASILAGLLGTITLDRVLERPAAARRASTGAG